MPSPSQTRRGAALAVTFAICSWGAAGAAGAQVFTPPVSLSLNGYASNVGVGIDVAGNAMATWSDEGMYFAVKPAGGAWGPAQKIFISGAFPMLCTTASGGATLVSYENSYGIWSQDLLPSGSWGPSTLIVSAPEIVSSTIENVRPVQFLCNAKGDQAIVFEQRLKSLEAITVVRRLAGGTWGAEDNVVSTATYSYIALSSAALSNNGDIVVTFEPYTVKCDRACHQYNFSVHASREPAGTLTWSDSGQLTALALPYFTESVLDPTGHAGVIVENGFSGLIQATTQAKAGAKWRPLKTLFSNSAVLGAQMWGADASAAGHASLAFVGFGSLSANVIVVDGLLTKNVWPRFTILSSNDNPTANNVMAFGGNPAGGSMAEWADTDGTVRASFRKNIRTKWSVPQTITGGSGCNVGGMICTNSVGAGINASGQGVIAYLRTDPSGTYTTLYVSTE